MHKYVAVCIALGLVLTGVATGSLHNTSKAQKVVSANVAKQCVYIDMRAGQTRGDLSVLPIFKTRHCIVGKRGARGVRGAQGVAGTDGADGKNGVAGVAGPAGTNGTPGPAGPTGATGPQGPSIGTFGPVSLSAQDHGCVTDDPGDPNEPWANTTENRSYVVDAMQDGSGYIVTRYDLNGAFTTIPESQHPGCQDDSSFTTETTGTWNGVWSQNISGEFDYNPDAAIPPSATWDDFIAAVFGDDGDLSPTVNFLSYEFDYYSSCGDHWRDSQYVGGTNAQTGTIGDC